MVRGAETTNLTEKHEEAFLSKIRSPDAGISAHRIAAVEIPLNNILDHGTKIGENRKNRDTPDAQKELIPLKDEMALFYNQLKEAAMHGIIQSASVPLQAAFLISKTASLMRLIAGCERHPKACRLKRARKVHICLVLEDMVVSTSYS